MPYTYIKKIKQGKGIKLLGRAECVLDLPVTVRSTAIPAPPLGADPGEYRAHGLADHFSVWGGSSS